MPPVCSERGGGAAGVLADEAGAALTRLHDGLGGPGGGGLSTPCVAQRTPPYTSGSSRHVAYKHLKPLQIHGHGGVMRG